MGHVGERLLGLYALDPALVSSRREIEAHLAECDTCKATLEEIRVFDLALAEPETWRDAEENGTREDELREFAIRRAAEDAAAMELLKAFESPEAAPNFVWEDVARKPEFQTGGVARRLCKLANGMCERQPLYALSLAEAATRIGAVISDAAFPRGTIHELRGETWKEQANAFRFLGRFNDALKALDAAEAEYRFLPHAGVGSVAVKYIRAYVLFEQDQFDAAEALAEEAARDALHLGETDRYMRAQHLRAEIRLEQGDAAAAAEHFAKVLAYGEKRNDAVWIARESLGLGVCFVALRDAGEAERHLHRAVRLFRELGFASEVARTHWTIARLCFLQGSMTEATHQLRTTIRELAGFGMLTDAAVASVDLAEMLDALGRTREIPKVLAGVVQTFTDAGKLTGALTALAYLKDAAIVGTIAPTVFPYLRRYLMRAERQPGLLFAPPPPRA